MPQTPPLPVPAIALFSTELHLSGVEGLRALSPRHYDRSVMLLLLLRLCVTDWVEDGAIRRPPHLTRFAQIGAIAASLDRPFETVRRHVRALEADGLIVATGRQIAVGNDPATAARIVALLVQAHDVLLRFAAELHALGVLPPSSAPRAAPLTPAIVTAALDVYLLPFESLGVRLGDWTSTLVWGAVSGAAVRHVTTDTELSARYAYQPTPETLRLPAPISAILRLTGLPRVTVWRHLRDLAARGAIARKGDGWIVPGEQLAGEVLRPAVLLGALYYRRRLSRLIRQGFDPAAIDRHYIVGRPPYAALGDDGRETSRQPA